MLNKIRQLRTRQSTRFRIVLGLTGILVSLLLLAAMIGLVPDRHGAIRDGHARVAEAIAVNTSIFITNSDIRRMKANLQVIVDRNDDIVSAAVRRKNGEIIAEIGEHREQWQTLEEEKSSSQVTVPIYEGHDEWGQVELNFEPLLPAAWYGRLMHPLFLLLGYISLTSFIVYYMYLGKMLKQLDPSQAIPDRVRSALDTMAEGLLVIDSKHNVVLANQSFASLVGEPAEELIGRQISRFSWCGRDDESIDADNTPWSHTLEDGIVRTSEMIRLKQGGVTNKTFMTNCSPVLSGSGKASGVLISFDDISELEQKEVELRISKEEAEQANRFKSEFLANMSHEIRTPMNAILGFAEILKRGYDRDSRDSIRYLNTISSSGNHLLNVINDILDLSKVEAGRIEIETIHTPVHGVVHEVVQIMKVKADEKGIRLEYKPTGPLPEYIESDAGKLKQIITNLVGNAIKFTDKGVVTIDTRLEKRGENSLVFIDVIDTGIGMTAEQATSVFTPFKQADSSITRRFGGTGLGLTISKQFSQALGGDITVESEPGVGSTFRVSVSAGPVEGVRLLSVDEILSTQWRVEDTQTKRWKFPPSSVLVVDDGEENRELLNVVLSDTGIEVVAAENGQQALDNLSSREFDVVLMDVQMPVMDGYTAAGRIREMNKTMPVVAMTADAMAGAEQKCLDAGYSHYMSKPVDIDELLECMAELLGGELLVENQAAASVRVKTSDAAIKENDTDKIYSTLPTSNKKYRNIVEKFIIRLEEQLAVIDAAWSDRNYVELKRLGHWLKGSAGSVGFAAFVEPAAEFEQLAINKDDAKLERAISTLHSLYSRLEVQTDDNNGNSKESMNTIKDYVIPEKVICRLVDANPRLMPIVEKFTRQLENSLNEIDTAVEQNNFDEIRKFAYWLKASGGTMGYGEFTEPAAHLEASAKAKQIDVIKHTIGIIKEIRNRMESLISEHESGTDLHVKLVGK
jgi:PAS domain S-box-containing protein